jgi:predicted secreted protein
MAGILAKGTQLRAGGLVTMGASVLITGVRNITGPGTIADVLDATSMDTPGQFRDKAQGLKDWGTLACDCLWDPANAMHLQIFNDFVAGAERWYELIFPDPGTTTFTFKGFINSCPVTAAFDQLLTRSFEITIKGDPLPTFA